MSADLLCDSEKSALAGLLARLRAKPSTPETRAAMQAVQEQINSL